MCKKGSDYIDIVDKFFKDSFNKNTAIYNENGKEYFMRRISDTLKDIKDIYYICDGGYVYSENIGRFLKSHSDHKRGYIKVDLYNKFNNKISFGVHRLLMIVFNYTNNYNDMVVNHKDLNKKNNYLYNLEWVSNRENWRHSIRNGVRDDYGDYIKNLDIVHDICYERQRGERPKHISDKIGVSYDAVKKICNGDNYTDIVKQYKFGEMHKFRSLTLDQIECIINDLKYSDLNVNEIANKYNTNKHRIYDVRDIYIKNTHTT
ncbi:MAG: hypothetical protein ACOCRK_01950 [bacterium]